jgi:GxxExxY protein
MAKGELLHGALTRSILGAFFEVYNELGFGFLEQIYVAALVQSLLKRGHGVARELGVQVLFKGSEIGFQRLDVVVDDLVIVEVKSTANLARVAPRQLYNYLRATRLEVGLLLHFGPEPKFYRLVYENRLKGG